MDRDADAAAHHNAVDQRDVGLGETLDVSVERIFVAPERQHLGLTPGAAEFVERAYVAAGREGPLPRRRDDDAGDRRVVRPCLKLARERAHHLVRHRIERFWAVKTDNPGSAAALETNMGTRRIHAAG